MEEHAAYTGTLIASGTPIDKPYEVLLPDDSTMSANQTPTKKQRTRNSTRIQSAVVQPSTQKPKPNSHPSFPSSQSDDEFFDVPLGAEEADSLGNLNSGMHDGVAVSMTTSAPVLHSNPLTDSPPLPRSLGGVESCLRSPPSDARQDAVCDLSLIHI